MHSDDCLPLTIHTYSTLGPTPIGQGFASNPGLGALTWVANLVTFVPIWLPWPYPVHRVFWVNGSTASSNAEFGIYDKSQRKIYSTGSTVQSGASTIQFVTPGTPFWLDAGEYYFAVGFTGTTNRAAGASALTTIMLRHMGVKQQSSAIAMPDPATFAAPTSALFPVCGITRTMSGF